MAVAELVKHAAVFVEEPVIRVNQFEKGVAAEELLAGALAGLRIEIADPRAAVGIVVDGHHVFAGTVAASTRMGTVDPRVAFARGQSKLQLDTRRARALPGIQTSTQNACAFCPSMRLSGSGSRERYGVRTGTSASG